MLEDRDLCSCINTPMYIIILSKLQFSEVHSTITIHNSYINMLSLPAIFIMTESLKISIPSRITKQTYLVLLTGELIIKTDLLALLA